MQWDYHHLLQIRSGPISVVGSKWSQIGCLFSKTLSYLEVELEEKKKSSFLCLSTTTFRFLDDIFYVEPKLRKQEKPNETNTS